MNAKAEGVVACGAVRVWLEAQWASQPDPCGSYHLRRKANDSAGGPDEFDGAIADYSLKWRRFSQQVREYLGVSNAGNSVEVLKQKSR